MNEAQHGGTHKISLERAQEKSVTDRPDPVWYFHYGQFKMFLNIQEIRKNKETSGVTEESD